MLKRTWRGPLRSEATPGAGYADGVIEPAGIRAVQRLVLLALNGAGTASSKMVPPIRSYTSGLALRQYRASAIEPRSSATDDQGDGILKNSVPDAAPAAVRHVGGHQIDHEQPSRATEDRG